MSRPMTYAHWTTRKLARLRECSPTMSAEDLAREFAPHPIGSIMHMARGMKLRKTRDWRTICAQHKSTVFRDGRYMGVSV
jgi:hypothetical protein